MSLSSKLIKLTFFALACGVSFSAHGSVAFTGNFETGNLTQWTKYQAASSARVRTLTSPVAQGHYAARFEVRHGDLAASGNRAEVVHGTPEVEGNERYFSWSTMFDANYPIQNAWQLFTQWHHSGPNGSPPIEFGIYGSSIKLTRNGSTTLWTAPLVRGKWHKFVAHIKFSASASVGFIEVYYDGVKVMKKNYATLYPGQTDYLKQGLYRSASIQPTGVIYHDGMVEGTHLAEVASELVSAAATLEAQDAAAFAAEPTASTATFSERAAVEMSASELAQMESERQDSSLENLAGIDTIEADSQASLAAGTGCSSGGTSIPTFALAALALVALARRRRSLAVKASASGQGGCAGLAK